MLAAQTSFPLPHGALLAPPSCLHSPPQDSFVASAGIGTRRRPPVVPLFLSIPSPLLFVSLSLSRARARLSLHSLCALSPCLSIAPPLSSKPLSLSCSLSHRRVYLDRETDSLDSKQATMGIAHAGPAPAAMCERAAVTTDCLVMRMVANVSCLMCELTAVTTDSGALQLGVECSCHMSDEELEA